MKITLIAEYVVNGKSEMKYESCWKEIIPGDQTANANRMNVEYDEKQLTLENQMLMIS